MRNYYVSGDWNATCQRCGFKYKASKLTLEWTGLRVCSKCFETRHPQDFIRGVEDHPATPWATPEVTDTFIPFGEILTTEDGRPITTQGGAYILTET